MEFIEGDSCFLQSTKLKPDSLDVIINIESSHCYSDLNAFYEGVAYLLKPDGVFIYVDWNFMDKLEYIETTLKKHFVVQKQEDISQNVLKALNVTSEMKKQEIVDRVPFMCRRIIG